MLGSPIEHSLSPALHRAAYVELGLTRWVYDRFDVRADALADVVNQCDPSWRGLSLTMPLKTEPLDLADLLKTPEDQAEFLRVSMEEGDMAEINHALGIIARARGMTEVARASGLGRESLYKALREDSRPEFGTILRVMKALGLKLTVVPA